jgi:hypothetical protein
VARDGFAQSRVSLTTTILMAVIAVVVTVFVTAKVAGRGSDLPEVTSFRGQVSSTYDGGGCIRADSGQGLSTADDDHCGLFFVAPGRAVSTGDRVSAVFINEQLPSDEAVQGYLIAPGAP